MIFKEDNPARIRWNIYLCAAALFVGYQCINAFVANADMILATRVLAAGFYATVLYVYGPDAWGALTSRQPKRTDFLVIGIWISFASHMGQSLYSIVYRLAPSTWLMNSEVVSPIVLLAVVASVLHIIAPGAVDGTVPRRNRIALGLGVGCATLLVCALLLTRPDIRPYVDEMRPWIGDWWRTGGLFRQNHA